MKRKILAATILLVLATSSLAITKKPEQCPSTDSIKTVTIDEKDLIPMLPGYYVTKLIVSKFNTKDSWSFSVSAYANSNNEALSMMNRGLSMPVFDKGPYKNKFHKWACDYHAAFNKEIEMNAYV
jgi:hypothetical protein